MKKNNGNKKKKEYILKDKNKLMIFSDMIIGFFLKFTVNPNTFPNFTILGSKNTLTILYTIHPISTILSTIGELNYTVSVFFIIFI